MAKQDGARLSRHQSRWRKVLLCGREAKQKQIIISSKAEGATRATGALTGAASLSIDAQGCQLFHKLTQSVLGNQEYKRFQISLTNYNNYNIFVINLLLMKYLLRFN